MPIAARIRQVRIENLLTREELARKAGLSRSLLASFENGLAVPTLEMFDSLAEAMGVPLARLFYGEREATMTPRLTPRLTLQQLAGEPSRPASAGIAGLLAPRMLRAAIRKLRCMVTLKDGSLGEEKPHPTLNSTGPHAETRDNSRDHAEDGKPGA
jgi:transcriptional regulator with XRE-family HTH domain